LEILMLSRVKTRHVSGAANTAEGTRPARGACAAAFLKRENNKYVLCELRIEVRLSLSMAWVELMLGTSRGRPIPKGVTRTEQGACAGAFLTRERTTKTFNIELWRVVTWSSYMVGLE